MKETLSAEAYKDFLMDTLSIIEEMAKDAKKPKKAVRTDFEDGYLSCFHRVVSLFQQQAEAFGISNDEIGLGDIDPDADLV